MDCSFTPPTDRSTSVMAMRYAHDLTARAYRRPCRWLLNVDLSHSYNTNMSETEYSGLTHRLGGVLGGSRGNRTLLDTRLARRRRDPSLPP